MKRYKIGLSLFVSFLMFILIHRLLEGGNRVEEFALVLQALSLWIIDAILSKNSKRQEALFGYLGILGTTLFLSKPNLVGITIAFAIVYMIFNFSKSATKKIFILLVSALLMMALVLIYFFFNSALFDYIDQVYVFNWIYANSSTKDVFTISVQLFKNLFPISALIFLYPLTIWLKAREKKFSVFDLFIYFWLLIELSLALVSKRQYSQYFLTTVIPFSFVTADAITFLLNIFSNRKMRSLMLGLLLIIFVLFDRFELHDLVRKIDDRKPLSNNLVFKSYLFNNFQEHQEAIDVINKFSDPNDKILIWGSEPSLLYITKRKSVDKYYYQLRLFLPGYDIDQKKKQQLLNDLISNRPKLIIDASRSTTDIDKYPQMPPLDHLLYQEWLTKTNNQTSPMMLELIDWIKANYIKGNLIYEKKWQVYYLK